MKFSGILRDRSRITVPMNNLKVIAREKDMTLNELLNSLFTFEITEIRPRY